MPHNRYKEDPMMKLKRWRWWTVALRGAAAILWVFA